MKNTPLSVFIKKRIKENEKLFTKSELSYIKKHYQCVKKIYLLGFIDGKDCYDKF